MDPRVPFVIEWARDGVRLFDVEIPPGTEVWSAIVGAHRDPAVYPDPYRFDVARVHARPQLNFGTGRHYCIGAALARMELQVLLEVLASRWTAFELAGESVVRRDRIGIFVSELGLVVNPE